MGELCSASDGAYVHPRPISPLFTGSVSPRYARSRNNISHLRRTTLNSPKAGHYIAPVTTCQFLIQFPEPAGTAVLRKRSVHGLVHRNVRGIIPVQNSHFHRDIDFT